MFKKIMCGLSPWECFYPCHKRYVHFLKYLTAPRRCDCHFSLIRVCLFLHTSVFPPGGFSPNMESSNMVKFHIWKYFSIFIQRGQTSLLTIPYVLHNCSGTSANLSVYHFWVDMNSILLKSGVISSLT